MTKNFIKTNNTCNYIFFDLDGTITNTYEGITKCFQLALAAYNINVKQEDLLQVIGPPLLDSFRNFYGFDKVTAEDAVEIYRKRYREVGWRENSLYNEVLTTLKGLKEQGKKIALATSKPYVFAKQILDDHNISKYFDAIVGAELDGSFGAKYEVIQKAIELLGNPNKDEIIMVGDRKYDIEGAKQSGILSLGVKYGFGDDDELENAGADYIVDTEEDMKNFLLNL